MIESAGNSIPAAQPAPKDGEENSHKNKAAKFVKENKLKVAGIGQVTADTALLAYGFIKGNPEIGSIGALGYTAGIIGMRYGNPKDEKQLELVERHLGEYLQRQGVEIPKEPTTQGLMKRGGIIDHVEEFIYAHPTQLINTCFGLMGVQFMRGGMRENQKSMMASGAFMMASALAGLLIKEQKPDPDHPPQGTLAKAWSWVQEKPLMLSGILANLNQVSLAYNTYSEYKANPSQKAYMLKAVAVAGFLLCNCMLGMSSSGHGGGEQMDDETRDKLAETAARVIAAQPKEVQDAVLERISGFLATQPYVHLNAEEISAMLRKKVEEVARAHPASAGQAR